MEDFPSLEDALAAMGKMQLREKREQQVFQSTVDQEEAITCFCQCCPPRHSQEEGDYCCASLFSLPLLKKGILLRDGLIAKLKEGGSHSCITEDPLFKDCILKEEIALTSAETFSMLSGEPITDQNKALRYGAYRHFVAKTIGHLGKGVRIRLPSCFVHTVREKWPSANYTGFS
ncbi:hypothetical protein PMAYCL1PPCAC_16004, partial [Pristionchus mayeri]